MKLVVGFLTGIMALQFANARVGTETGNGGDDIGLDFQASLNLALKELSSVLPKEIQTYKLDNLYSGSSGARILVIDEAQKVVVDGITQDCVATSDSETHKTIITRARWTKIKSTHVKAAIALHEALVLVGAESTGRYPISSLYLTRFGLSDSSILSGDPELQNPSNKFLTVRCRPTTHWRADAADDVAALYLVFDGKHGLSDPTLVIGYNTEAGIPGGYDTFRTTLDSEASGKMTYKIGEHYGSRLPIVWLDSLRLDFQKISLGSKGKGVAFGEIDQTPGVHRPQEKHDLNCIVVDRPPGSQWER